MFLWNPFTSHKLFPSHLQILSNHISDILEQTQVRHSKEPSQPHKAGLNFATHINGNGPQKKILVSSFLPEVSQ